MLPQLKNTLPVTIQYNIIIQSLLHLVLLELLIHFDFLLSAAHTGKIMCGPIFKLFSQPIISKKKPHYLCIRSEEILMLKFSVFIAYKLYPSYIRIRISFENEVAGPAWQPSG